ncbi:ceramidase [Scheffersomyces xylosifermentans]|uniref:ceramidase n=1 Tax=Scheffersomyces xylosifermentans TaxID=1304137 RepID=UPI00315D10C1
MLPFAIPYPPEKEHGFWGIPTSTIDWCEENYVVSTYIAEALNTITNSVFIALAAFAIFHAYNNKLEPRFLLTGFGFLLVGIGSWLFHMTLRYQFQLLDELPMIYATCVPFWSVFSEFKTKKESVFVGVGIFVAANSLTAIYLYFKDPTIHQVAYALLNACIIFKSLNLTREHVHDKAAKAQLYTTMVAGVALFGFGYFLWNLDIHFCDFVRGKRREWGIPYGFVLEGHGWWHIFTGLGVYFYLVYEEYLRCFLTGTEKFFGFKWVIGLPIVSCVDKNGLDRHNAIKRLAQIDEEYQDKKNR